MKHLNKVLLAFLLLFLTTSCMGDVEGNTPKQIASVMGLRSEWVYELTVQRSEVDHVYFEYQVRGRVGDPVFLLNSHRAQIRTDHQRIVVGPNGGLMHVDAGEVLPQDMDAFIASDPAYYTWVDKDRDGNWRDDRGRTLAPYIFAAAPWAGGHDEELDPQWERETFTVPLAGQIDELVNRYLDRAAARGWTGDKRGTTLNLQVGASADDAFQFGTGTNANIDSLVFTLDKDTDWGGNRWQNVTIPSGATIDSAVFQGDFHNASADEPLHNLDFEDADSPGQFTTGVSDLENRTLTGSPVLWDNTNLGTAGHLSGDAAEFFTSPSLVTPLQIVVNRAGFTSGASVVLIIVQPVTDATRDYGNHTYDGNTTHAAKMDIDYTAAAAGTSRVIIIE